MRGFGKVLKFLGHVVLGVSVAAIVISYLYIAWTQGFWALTEILSPFNYANMILVFLTLAPGAFLVWAGGKLADR